MPSGLNVSTSLNTFEKSRNFVMFVSPHDRTQLGFQQKGSHKTWYQTILTAGVFESQLSSNAGISVWRSVWVTTNRCLVSDMRIWWGSVACTSKIWQKNPPFLQTVYKIPFSSKHSCPYVHFCDISMTWTLRGWRYQSLTESYVHSSTANDSIKSSPIQCSVTVYHSAQHYKFCIHFPLSLQNSMKRISCSYLTRAITFCHTSGKIKEKLFMSLLSSDSTRQCTYNVILGCIYETLVAVEKQ